MAGFIIFVHRLLSEKSVVLKCNRFYMDSEKMEKGHRDVVPKNNGRVIKLIVALVAIILLGGGGFVYYLLQTKNAELDTLRLQSEEAKQQLAEEYQNLAVQYEGFKYSVRNDSLLMKLEREQARVESLQEELRNTKASNQAVISRLRTELADLRKILQSYVAQIDSLNRLNAQLVQEKTEITNRYNETSRSLEQVQEEKEDLSHKVALAAKLDAINIVVKAVNKRGREQKRISKVEQFVVSFSIAKNITAEPGERTVYVRIMKPDDDVLTKSRGDVFPYENTEINYSMRRIIEYTGEETPVTLYWTVEEYLQPGTYRVDIFSDGNRIGTQSISFDK